MQHRGSFVNWVWTSWTFKTQTDTTSRTRTQIPSHIIHSASPQPLPSQASWTQKADLHLANREIGLLYNNGIFIQVFKIAIWRAAGTHSFQDQQSRLREPNLCRFSLINQETLTIDIMKPELSVSSAFWFPAQPSIRTLGLLVLVHSVCSGSVIY